MADSVEDKDKVHATKKPLHPYACINVEIEEQLENPYVAARAAAIEQSAPAERSSESSRLRQSENPYATLYYRPPPEHDSSESIRVSAARARSVAGEIGMSKLDFRRKVSGLFGRYMPAAERNRLRPHHQAFIARVESRLPKFRRAVWEELVKYDLADSPGLATQFNRESSAFTEEKLAKIEAAVQRLFPED